jgi:DNA-binding protein HU-beta
MTVGRQELEAKVVEELGITKTASHSVINAVLKGIEELTKEHGKLELRGFGNFEIGERSERKGHNPQTRKEMVIPARKTFKFKASKKLKNKIN